jgi:glycosyltransferase involved in cell wall biosynthesis
LKLRILFIAPRYLPEIGGVEKHVNYVSNRLTQKGCNIKILTATYNNGFPSNENQESIQIFRLKPKHFKKPQINSIYNLTKIWFYLIKNFKLLLKTDVIHLHDTQTFLWLLPFIKLIRKPVYITFHGFDKYPIPSASRILRKLAEKMLAGNICIGEFLKKWYSTEPNFVTIGGVEPPIQTTNQPRVPQALFVGRLAEDTNILDFVEAINMLKAQFNVNLPLHICGDGPLRNAITDKASRNKLNITLHGFTLETQKHLAVSSYGFVTGYLAILEAMANNLPVFAIYNNPLKKDYLNSIPNNQEIMTIASSPQDLANKLNQAIGNQNQLNETTKKAHEFARSQTWDKVADLYLKLYKTRGNNP